MSRLDFIDLEKLDNTIIVDVRYATENNFTYYDLPLAALAHRELLEMAMIDQGFLPLPTEWWHFTDSEWENYPVEDLPFEELEQTCGSLS